MASGHCGVTLQLETEEYLHKILCSRREKRTSEYQATTTRTRKKIERAYTVLTEDYGFELQMVEDALRVTDDLDSALDFLCLNYMSDKLPKRFAAEKSDALKKKKAKSDAKEGSLQVQVHEGGAPAPSVIVEEEMKTKDIEEIKPRVELDAAEIKAKEEKQRARDWTRQYMEMEAERQLLEKKQRQEEKEREQKIKSMGPLDRYKLEVEKLEALQVQASNAKKEKNKSEQKKVGKEIGEQRKRVQVLRHSISPEDLKRLSEEKTCAKSTRDQEKASPKEFPTEEPLDKIMMEELNIAPALEAEDNDQVGFMEMFEESEESAPPAPPVQGVVAQSAQEGLKFDSCKWTGQNPVKYLEQWCHKKRIRRPKYKEVVGSRRGFFRFSVIVELSSKNPTTCTTEDSYALKNDAKEAVANRILYDLNSDVPLYRVFAPHHRDNWLSWIQKKEERVQTILADNKTNYQDIIQRIYESGLHSTPIKGTPKPDRKVTNEVVLQSFDDWDADNDDIGQLNACAESATNDNFNFGHVPTASTIQNIPTTEGKKLQCLIEARVKSKKYKSLLESRTQLPIASFKNEIISALNSNNVILVSGSTGCGKTTQTPQFILQEALRSGFGDSCSMICTQPRRIAATSVAERVAVEMGEVLGKGDSLVGYQIRMEAVKTPNTRLLFCTTGVLLRRLQDDPDLNGVSHVVVDEVHERDLQCDFLLCVLRTLLLKQQNMGKRSLKVVLMSATVDSAKFASYFGGCPVITVPGRLFPVEEFFLEDALEATGHIIEEGSRCAIPVEKSVHSAVVNVSGQGGRSARQRVTWTTSKCSATQDTDVEYSSYMDRYSDLTQRSMEKVDPAIINYELIEDLLTKLFESSDLGGAVLIFMPGLAEIQNLVDLLSSGRKFGNRDQFWILPLHSSIASSDQRRVFEHPPPNISKIIISTNIAETSVTIDDVTVVIDTGKVKQMHFDHGRLMQSLQESWISKASAKQRMGRAGRVTSGKCFRMYPREVATYVMKDHDIPEIQRSSLIDLCLQIKVYGYGSCEEFLAKALDPPRSASVSTAIQTLKDIGALDNYDGSENEEGELTALGRHLSVLPVNVKIGKMLIYGAVFRCLDPILAAAAIMECQSPFVVPYGKQKQVEAAKKAFLTQQSDLLTDVHAFQCWEKRLHSEGSSEEKKFAQRYFLHRQTMFEIQRLKRQFAQLISRIGFIESKQVRKSEFGIVNAEANEFSKHWCIVSSILCAGLYPNLLQLKPSVTGKSVFYEQKQQVFLHPSSINARQQNPEYFASCWVGYHEKIKTSRVFVRSTSVVSPYAILLFGGNMKIDIEKGIVVLEDWVEMKCTGRNSILVRELRVVLKELLQAKIDNPKLSLSSVDTDMVQIVARLLTEESEKLEN